MPIVQTMENGRLADRAESREASSNTRAAKSMREQEDTDLREIIESFGADKAFELKVIRRQPRMWGDTAIDGHLGTYEEWLSEEEIDQQFGGGTYTLKVYRPNAKGSMVYFKSATVKLPGPPKGKGIKSQRDDDDDDDRGRYEYHQPPEDTSVVSQAINTLQEVLRDERAAKGSSGFDPVMLETLMAPLRSQLEQSNLSIREIQDRSQAKDDRIMELITKKPEASGSERLLDKMWDTQQQRTEQMRAMHDSELRVMRENARDDMKRMEDRHTAELRSREEAHRRELDSNRRASDMQENASRIAYEARIESEKRENERLRADVAEMRAELVALRAKKDKSLMEQAAELQQVGESLSSLGIGGFSNKDDEEEHWTSRLTNSIMENPDVITKVMEGMGRHQAPQPTQQTQQQPQPQAPNQAGQQEVIDIDSIPPGQPFQGEDGEVYVKVPSGQVVLYREAVAMAEEESREKTKSEGRVPAPTEKQVKIAVAYAEGAYKNNIAPEVFARSARSSVPGELLDYIIEVGVDTFLNDVAELDPASPLKTQAGRNYMREVAKFLSGG